MPLNIALHISITETPKIFEQSDAAKTLEKNSGYAYFDLDNHGDSLYCAHLKNELTKSSKCITVIEIESETAPLGPVLSIIQGVSQHKSANFIISGTHAMIQRITRINPNVQEVNEEKEVIAAIKTYFKSN